MKIAIISGNNRQNSQSFRVSEWIEERLRGSYPDLETDLIDLKTLNLSFNPDEYWEGKSEAAKDMAAAYARLNEADGVVIVTPEWGGAASPVLKHFILMSGHSFAHKPILSVGVSATPVGGIRPIEDLKHLFKNARGVIIPEPIVINSVNTFAVERSSDQLSEQDTRLFAHFDYSLKLLLEYSKALVQVRESGVIDNKNFEFGM